MHVVASGGVLTVELRNRFGLEEAERLHEAVHALAPVSALVLDFAHVTDFQNAAIHSLAQVLGELPEARLEVRGVTLHQARLLEYVRRTPTVDVSGHA